MVDLVVNLDLEVLVEVELEVIELLVMDLAHSEDQHYQI